MTNRTAYANLRRRMLFPALFAGGFGLAFFSARDAHAQAQGAAWTKDPRVGEGQGIPVGDLELHPGIGAEGGYDTNWFQRTHHENPDLVNGAPAKPPEGAFVIRVTPSFSANTAYSREGLPPVVLFRGGLSASLVGLLGSSEIRDQSNIGLGANARVDFNQNRPIGAAVFAGYSRIIQPQVNNQGDPDRSFNRNDINAGAEVVAMPGGGTLDLRAQYQAYASLYEQTEGVPFTNVTHEVSERNRWRFRPRTALFHDTTLRFITYPNAARATSYLDESTPIRTRLGLTGLVTDHLGTLLAAGYGASFYKDPGAASTPQYDSINAQAELTYFFTPDPSTSEPGKATLLLSTITAGYVRDFQNSLLANVYTSNKGYLKFVYIFGPRAVLQIGGEFESLDYPQPFLNNGPNVAPTPVTTRGGGPVGAFTNYRINGNIFGEYRLTSSLGINATFDYTQIMSDTVLAAGGGPGNTQFFDLAWRRIQAFIGARYFL